MPPRAEPGGCGNASSWAFDWTERSGSVSHRRVWSLKAKVREKWDGRRSGTSTQLRDDWNRYLRGWWGYFRLAEARGPIFALEGWVRRHIRKCFWLRWHGRKGRLRNLRRLGLRGSALGVATSRRGAWRVAAQPELHQALSNTALRRTGFLFPSDLAATKGGWVQPPDAENRMSGGVGGWRGAIPVTRPDPGLPAPTSLALQHT